MNVRCASRIAADLVAFGSVVWHRLFGGLLLFAMTMSPMASAATEPIVDSAKTLVDDPYYVTEGAVTSFRTCLGVANDHRAMKLWDSKDPGIVKAKAASKRDRLAVLRDLDRQVKLSLGFGTIITCAQIAEAWLAEGRSTGSDARMSDDPNWQDGRRRHGTVVIDLAMGPSRYRVLDDAANPKEPLTRDEAGILRGAIEAIPLVRILTSPRLLPPRDFGGVVVRNAEIDGALLFYNHRMELPLAFANVHFRGHNYQKTVFGNDREPPVLDTAIAFANAHLAGHVQISASDICGTVRLTDSHFADTVSFRRIRQYGVGCSARTAEAAMPELRIERSTFLQGLTTTETALGSLHVTGSRIQRFISSHSRFGTSLEMVESQFGSLKIRCSILAERAEIARNRIDMDLVVEGTDIAARNSKPDAECFDWWQNTDWRCDQAHVTIASNDIGGGFYFRNFLRSALATSLRLASNRVGNGSEIVLPGPDVNGEAWRGDVDRWESNLQRTLTVTHNRWPVGKPRTDWAEAQFCDEIKKGNPPTGITVEFRAAHIGTLRWDLPLTCDYRWLGYGMTYDLWMKGRLATTSLGDLVEGKTEAEKDHLALYFWRKALRRYDSSSLGSMSEYLAGKGVHVDSRNILEEAKRLNYAKQCRPDSSVFKCIYDVVFGPAEQAEAKPRDKASGRCALAKMAEASDDDPETPKERLERTIDEDLKKKMKDDQPRAEAMSWRERAYQAGMVFLLAPGGYGAKPEQALVLIAIVALFFLGLYLGYSHYLRWRLSELPRLIDLQSDDQSATKAGDAKARGLGEKPRIPFLPLVVDAAARDQSQPWPGELVAHWPKSDDWAQWGTAERLARVQKDLLPRLDRCLQDAPDPKMVAELKTLRRKLERFGSTQKLGFSQFDGNKQPTRFSHWRYCIDTMVPFIDLHGYSSYYPESTFMRLMSVIQHVIGWWLMTVFVASAAIL